MVRKGEGHVQEKVPWPGAERPPSAGAVTSEVMMPAMEATLITREGCWWVAPLRRRASRPTVTFHVLFVRFFFFLSRTWREWAIP